MLLISRYPGDHYRRSGDCARGGALPPGNSGVFRSGAPRCRVRGARLPGCAQRLGDYPDFIVLGTGIGIAQTISNDLMISSVPPRKAGAASAISETSYETGTVLGTVIIGGMLTAVYRANVVCTPTAWMRLSPTTPTKPSEVPCRRQPCGWRAGEPAALLRIRCLRLGVVLSSAFSAVLMGVMAVISYFMIRKAPREMEAQNTNQRTNPA